MELYARASWFLWPHDIITVGFVVSVFFSPPHHLMSLFKFKPHTICQHHLLFFSLPFRLINIENWSIRYSEHMMESMKNYLNSVKHANMTLWIRNSNARVWMCAEWEKKCTEAENYFVHFPHKLRPTNHPKMLAWMPIVIVNSDVT